MIDLVRAVLLAIVATGAFAIVLVLPGVYLADRLAEIEQPTLVLVGADDQPDIHAVADQLVRTLPNVGFDSIPNAGHVPNMEQPERFDQIVGAFLEG